MKKIIAICAILLFVTCGCGKFTVDTAKKDFIENVNSSKSYKLEGNMEIVNNEETFMYSLEAYHLKDDYYKVILVNQTNNHEQIILRNKDGVYVVTPSLNKSFKFQSEWPYNSSQGYILSSLVNDIKNDSEVTLEQTDNNYILKSKVNYPNNSELTYQKLYFDKKMNLEKVEVFNSDNIVKIKVTFNKIDMKANLSEDDFLLEDLINDDCCKTEENCSNEKECPMKSENDNNNSANNDNTNNDQTQKTSNILDTIIYPLYIPSNTYLKTSEKVDTDSGDRVILTFAGDKNFVLIEQASLAADDFEIIPVYGDPQMVSDTVAALSANSLSWTTNSVDYYLASNELSVEEMLTIASSLNNTELVMGSK